jgi:hypothetical protein
MGLAGVGFGQSSRLINLGGLFQRASIITGFAWPTTLSTRGLWRTPAITTRRHPAQTAEHSPAARNAEPPVMVVACRASVSVSVC